MTKTVEQLHKELGDLIEQGAGKAVVMIEEEGEGYVGMLDNVNTWLVGGGAPDTLTLLGTPSECRPEPHWLDGEILLGFDGEPHTDGAVYHYRGARSLIEAQAAHRAWLRWKELDSQYGFDVSMKRRHTVTEAQIAQAKAEYEAIADALADRVDSGD